MTLEILIQDTEPDDVDTGTYLNNTTVIDIVPPMIGSSYENKTSVTGKPLKRWKASKAPSMNVELIVLETGITNLTTASLGLVDLDILRKAESGFDGASTKGLLVWLRDIAGDYFIRHWKGGYVVGLKINRIQGFQNEIGSALYKVTFKFENTFMGGDVHHQIVRW